jgi:hypothetical protein
MTELVFMIIEEAPEGGCTTRALGESIVTEAVDLDSLRLAIRDAAKCHFDPGWEPRYGKVHIATRKRTIHDLWRA